MAQRGPAVQGVVERQGRAAALSRTPPIELPAVTSAFLSLFATNWTPQGVDAKKLADAQARGVEELKHRGVLGEQRLFVALTLEAGELRL